MNTAFYDKQKWYRVIYDMILEQDIQFALEHDEAIEYKQYENEVLRILQLKTSSLNL